MPKGNKDRGLNSSVSRIELRILCKFEAYVKRTVNVIEG